MASYLHFLALLITESGFSSEFHTEHALHNNFIIKYLLSTHVLGQATTRNESIQTRQAEQSQERVTYIVQNPAKQRLNRYGQSKWGRVKEWTILNINN